MKKFAIITIFIISISVLLVGCSGEQEPVNILTVEQISDDPTAFTGTITINGVVANSLSETFGIETPGAGRPCCPSFILPVEYNGTFPEIGDEVNVTGSWGNESIDGIPVFQATGVQIQ